jgi:hypothetical protein
MILAGREEIDIGPGLELVSGFIEHTSVLKVDFRGDTRVIETSKLYLRCI